MNRRPVALLLTVGFVAYGIYAASVVVALTLGVGVPVLVIGFLIQAVAAFVAAVALWNAPRAAALAVVVLGASVAGTWLIEGFALGLVAYLRALVTALLAILISLVAAAYLARLRPLHSA
jgi:hypothetical protein